MTFLYIAFGLMCAFLAFRILKLFLEEGGAGKAIVQFAQLACIVTTAILCTHSLTIGFSGTFIWVSTVLSYALCVTLLIGIVLGLQDSSGAVVFTFIDWILAIAILVCLIFVCFVS
jgi:hypothetical protein